MPTEIKNPPVPKRRPDSFAMPLVDDELKNRPDGDFSARAFDPSREENTDLPDIRMRRQDIDRELDKRLKTMEGELRKKIPRFDTVPRSGQKALLDMQYNMGDQKFRGDSWPKFYKALDNRDWTAAAGQSSRRDVSLERNQAVRNWLLEADQEEKR